MSDKKDKMGEIVKVSGKIARGVTAFTAGVAPFAGSSPVKNIDSEAQKLMEGRTLVPADISSVNRGESLVDEEGNVRTIPRETSGGRFLPSQEEGEPQPTATAQPRGEVNIRKTPNTTSELVETINSNFNVYGKIRASDGFDWFYTRSGWVRADVANVTGGIEALPDLGEVANIRVHGREQILVETNVDLITVNNFFNLLTTRANYPQELFTGGNLELLSTGQSGNVFLVINAVGDFPQANSIITDVESAAEGIAAGAFAAPQIVDIASGMGIQLNRDTARFEASTTSGMILLVDADGNRFNFNWVQATLDLASGMQAEEVLRRAISEVVVADQNTIDMENYNGVPWPDPQMRISLEDEIQYNTNANATAGQLVITSPDGTRREYQISSNSFYDAINVANFDTHQRIDVLGTFVGVLGTRTIQNVETVTQSGQRVDYLSFERIGVTDIMLVVSVGGRQTNIIVSVPGEQVISSGWGDQPLIMNTGEVLDLLQPGVKTSVLLFLPNGSWEDFLANTLIEKISPATQLPIRQKYGLINLSMDQYGDNLEALSTNSAIGTIYVGPTHELEPM